MKLLTETKWLKCSYPWLMLEHLRFKASHRKLRLLAVACCRRIWPLLTAEASRVAVEVAEKYAEGEVNEEVLEAARAATYDPAAYGVVSTHAPYAARQVVECSAVRNGLGDEATCSLIREIFGNPFRPITVASTWLAWNDGTVPKIALAIHEEERWEDMLILADALEDSGCANQDMLDHCRSAAQHCRGCWCLDLLLGRE